MRRVLLCVLLMASISACSVSAPTKRPEVPATLDEVSLGNLVAFARLFGYVRYFHPSDQAASVDWGEFAISSIEPVVAARNPAQLRATLLELFSPVAPSVRIDTRELPRRTPLALWLEGLNADSLEGWRYHGYPNNDSNHLYFGERIRAKSGSAEWKRLRDSEELRASLGAGVWCAVPLALRIQHGETRPTPRRLASRLKAEHQVASGGDRPTRIADVILLWNAIRHFYPYLDANDSVWTMQLAPNLRRAASDAGGIAFEATIRRMIASLHDGHGSVNSPYGDPRVLPLALRFVEGRLIVVGVDRPASGRVRIGDEIIALGGRPTAKWVQELRSIKSAATKEALDIRVAEALHVAVRADSVTIDLRNEGEAFTVRLPRRRGPLPLPFRGDSVRSVAAGMLYVDLSRISDADWTEAAPRMRDARRLIFDLRGYPSRLETVVPGHFIVEPKTGCPWFVPIFSRPNQVDREWEEREWSFYPLAPRFRAETVFLIDAGAISKSEAILGMVQGHRLGTLIGSPTAGTNGNLAYISLPGGYDVTFTCVKATKCDGTPLQGVGLAPDIDVRPTVRGIRSGHDEVLERAIAWLSRK